MPPGSHPGVLPMHPQSVPASAIEGLSLDEVAARCAERVDAMCLELFRRALALGDQRAWDCLFRQYRRLAGWWLRRAPRRALCEADDDALIGEAFARLHRAIPPERFAAFPTLGALLRYLQRCCFAAVLDGRVSRDEDPLPDDLSIGDAAERIEAEAVWHCLARRLNSEAERVLVHASFVLDLKAAEILAEWPEHFPDIKTVYAVKANCLERLRRDPALRACLEGA